MRFRSKHLAYSKQLAPFGSLFAALLLVSAAWLLHAQAANAEELISEAVRYDDLNIHSESGRATLLKRIDAAIERVCAASSGYPRELYSRRTRECKRQALDEALRQLPAVRF